MKAASGQLAFGDTTVERSAVISSCGTYRYSLLRRWGRGPALRWIMLNPSTADADVDDPTLRRVVRFSRDNGYAAAVVANLYALRATDPAQLGRHPDPCGPANLATLGLLAKAARVDTYCLGRPAPVVAAWGANAPRAWATCVLDHELFGADLRCLGVTKAGFPRHPLYVRADQPLVRYPGARP